MKLLGTMKPCEGATKGRKRLGRGNGSGKGSTAGKGTKGQKARSGGGTRPGFEGGQMPLIRRLPKMGFFSRNHKEYNELNLDALASIAKGLQTDTLDLGLLMEHGLIKQAKDGLSVLGRGDLEVALTIKATRFSKNAREKIEKAGGKAEVV